MNKILILIILLLSLFYFLNFNENFGTTTQVNTTQVNTTQVTNKITLQEIIDKYKKNQDIYDADGTDDDGYDDGYDVLFKEIITPLKSPDIQEHIKKCFKLDINENIINSLSKEENQLKDTIENIKTEVKKLINRMEIVGKGEGCILINSGIKILTDRDHVQNVICNSYSENLDYPCKIESNSYVPTTTTHVLFIYHGSSTRHWPTHYTTTKVMSKSNTINNNRL